MFPSRLEHDHRKSAAETHRASLLTPVLPRPRKRHRAPLLPGRGMARTGRSMTMSGSGAPACAGADGGPAAARYPGINAPAGNTGSLRGPSPQSRVARTRSSETKYRPLQPSRASPSAADPFVAQVFRPFPPRPSPGVRLHSTCQPEPVPEIAKQQLARRYERSDRRPGAPADKSGIECTRRPIRCRTGQLPTTVKGRDRNATSREIAYPGANPDPRH